MTSPGPVTPHSDIPDDTVRAVAELVGWPTATGTGMGVGGDQQVYAEGLRESVAAVIAAVRPLIEAEERTRVADAIEAHAQNFDAYQAAYLDAARIARGEQP